MLIALLILCLFSIIWGFFGIQYTGNYENMYGYMFWFGLPLFVLFLVLKIFGMFYS